MKPTHFRMTLCLLALLAVTTLSGCMSMRPHPYNRNSFHALDEASPRNSVSRGQFARWHRKSEERHVATAMANSPKELDASLR